MKGRAYRAEDGAYKTWRNRRSGRKIGKKIVAHKELRSFVELHLLDDQSPENISKRLKRRERHLPYISARAIRAYISSVYGRKIEHHRAKIFKRYGYRKGARKRLEGKRMIDTRPSNINKRWGLGHMEGDFIVSGRSGKGMVLALRDRKTRYALLERILPISVQSVEEALVRMKKRYPEMQTLTLDNDFLFLEHQKLERLLSITIYFCHPASPHEKASIENLNKNLRRYIPKSSNISKYSLTYIAEIEEKLNRRFMDVLKSLTPTEAYEEEKAKRVRRSARMKRSN